MGLACEMDQSESRGEGALEKHDEAYEKCEARKKWEEVQCVRAERVRAGVGRKTWQRGESCAEEWAPPVQRRGVG